MRYFELLENLYSIGKGYINLNDNPDDIARSLLTKRFWSAIKYA